LKKVTDTNGLAFFTKVGTAILLVCFLIFSAISHRNSHVSKVQIKIKTRSDKKELVTKKDVANILQDRLGYDVSLASISKLNLYDLEAALEADDRISRAEVFVDKRNKLTIGILQNLPIARIEVQNGEDYYLDPSGSIIPVNGDVVRVPVVTGMVDPYVNTYRNKKDHNLNYVLTVVQKIYEDDFLSALVDQVHITELDDIILVPTMGREEIALGQNENLDDKIYRLKTYYKKGVKDFGLDRFKELNLRYDGQIVGVKKES